MINASLWGSMSKTLTLMSILRRMGWLISHYGYYKNASFFFLLFCGRSSGRGNGILYIAVLYHFYVITAMIAQNFIFFSRAISSDWRG
jgi:hypothetical protein